MKINSQLTRRPNMAKTVKIVRKFNTVLAIQEGSGNYKNDLTLKEAAAELGVSRYNLYKNYINTSVDREGLSRFPMASGKTLLVINSEKAAPAAKATKANKAAKTATVKVEA